MLELSNVTLGYGGNMVVREVSLNVGKGELVTIIGSNGAGKTTLLRAISGLIAPAGGSIDFDGAAIDGVPAERRVGRGLVHVPEGRMVLTRMTVRENLMLGAYCRQGAAAIAQDFEEILDMFPRLRERLGQMAGTLSGGEQQMLAIGRGLMSRPRLLMLDEPSLGIAPIIVETIFAVIRGIRDRGIAVLLVEQNARKALESADRGYVLDLGRIAADGLARDLLDDPRLGEAYLGL